jgi:hypothetical protein
MSEDWVVGRKAIIEYLRVPLQLSIDSEIAWRKVRRWKRDYGMKELFHRTPGNSPYVIGSEVELWLKDFESKHT